MLEKYLEINPEVKHALENNIPVVALESTIISHGMPYPQNAETALKVESIVRENGGIPATIGIIKGKLKVGLSPEEIELLGKEGEKVAKVSRRDIPYIVANKLNGATTVASTMIIANMAGVKIFATGGIGGVHRGAETTMDVSADLEELANTNVAVICAGAKSILDLGLTLEYLETHGVPVLGYQTKEFPEEYSMDSELINKVIKDAVAEAEKLGVKGKDTTPFLLDKIQKLTEGSSLKANIELVFNNTRLATKIAKELANLEK